MGCMIICSNMWVVVGEKLYFYNFDFLVVFKIVSFNVIICFF